MKVQLEIIGGANGMIAGDEQAIAVVRRIRDEATKPLHAEIEQLKSRLDDLAARYNAESNLWAEKRKRLEAECDNQSWSWRSPA